MPIDKGQETLPWTHRGCGRAPVADDSSRDCRRPTGPAARGRPGANLSTDPAAIA